MTEQSALAQQLPRLRGDETLPERMALLEASLTGLVAELGHMLRNLGGANLNPAERSRLEAPLRQRLEALTRRVERLEQESGVTP